jgi:hypothetical protein
MSEAPGWDAIDAALERIYGVSEPRHFAPVPPAAFGGTDPLQGISAYRSQFGGRAHWHFVTYGYSELFEKESSDPAVSGYGIEMTVRVTDERHTDEPPPWVLSMLQNIAGYVFRTGNVLEPGHHMAGHGPIALGRDTLLVAAAFTEDPQLPLIATPNGRVTFVQFVGLTQDEYDVIRDWDTTKLLALFGERSPALLTALGRRSWLEDPAIRQRVSEGIARDGSSTGALFMAAGSWEQSGPRFTLGVAANVVGDLQRLVRGRLAFGRAALLQWPDGAVTLEPGDVTRVVESDPEPRLTLSAADRETLLRIPIARGDYPLASDRGVVRVIPIEIFDGTRTHVERVIG